MTTNDSSSTTSRWLHNAVQQLRTAGIATARLDCLVLLEDTIGKDRSHILAHPKELLKGSTLQRLNEQLNRRIQHEPLAYIRGKTEFYGREFIVNAHTLEPRPETETMIDLALNILDKKYLIIDIGTGSGAIAVTMKLERSDATVIATDIDKTCIETASINSARLNADVKFYTGNLLEPISDINYQISNIAILANLPYVPDKYQLNEAAKFEPKHAIFGGVDGLGFYRKLFTQISDIKYQISYVLTESLPFQHEELALIAMSSGYKLKTVDDFIQIFVRN